MNRKHRRKLQQRGIIAANDPTKTFRLKFDINTPGGHLRSAYPSQTSGVIEASNEADLMRGIIMKLLDHFGFTPHDTAVFGLFGEVLNPLSNRLRGGIAFALIEGLGLHISLDEEEVCDDPKCGAVVERRIHPDPESLPDYSDDEDWSAPLIDVTRHAPECHVHREVDPEHPERPLRPAAYKLEEVVTVRNPRHFEPLNNKAIDPETGEVSTALEVPETGGGESTVDGDTSDVFVVTEDTDGETRTSTVDAATGI
jgi:hypothetical protein